MDTIKLKVKHKCLTERGEIKNLIHNYDCPDFQVKKSSFEYKGGTHTFDVSVEQQQMNWLDEQDKMSWMYDNEVTIIDYWLQKPTKKKDSFRKTVAVVLSGQPEDFVFDFFAAYDKMKGSLKGLSVNKKVKIILASMDLGYKAQLTLLKRLTLLIKGDVESLELSSKNIKQIN